VDEIQLLYRRQFLICRDVVLPLSHWNTLFLTKKLYIYSHPDLHVSHKKEDGKIIVLLGYIFDPVHFTKSDEEILADIWEKSDTFAAFIKALKGYTGQYVFIYSDGHSLNVIHDPLALREVYYCTSPNRVICGSQPNLVNEYSDPPLGITSDSAIQDFNTYDLKKIRSGRFWIGDETYFSGIKHLLPNHYLEINELKAKRYWPREKLIPVGLDEAVRISCSFLQGAMKAAAHRHELMMAVTSGTDSRTLLAASREICGNIYYFINKHKGLDAIHPDIYVPFAIFKRLDIPFHIHDLEGEIDEEFKIIFLKNTFLSTDLNLSAIYNVYYKQHNQRLNILGVGEIGRTFFGDEPQNIDGYYLARSMKIKDSPYAVEQCQKWLDSTLPVAQRCGVNTLTLLLWEQLLGNWGTVGNSESDIAIEEFDPFNSNLLYETLLGVDKKYSKYGESIIFREMIRAMWPELLEYPINPPYKKSDYIRIILTKIGIFAPLKSITYKVDRLRFGWKHRHRS
jgi:hypothetical protein